MLGYSLDEVMDLSCQNLTPARWHTYEQTLFEEQVMKNGFSEVYRKEYIKKDGTVIPVENQAWLIYDSRGKPDGLVGIIRTVPA